MGQWRIGLAPKYARIGQPLLWQRTSRLRCFIQFFRYRLSSHFKCMNFSDWILNSHFIRLGASPASQVLTTRTLGNRPTAPTSSYDFILANTTFLSLKLDLWDDHNCEILYFVIEYKMASADHWITVTNDLQPQARYSLRGLAPDTDYQLKVTAHNHAGSTSMRYDLFR